ncbi:hypothetical protein, partial [Metabacillus litoralis]
MSNLKTRVPKKTSNKSLLVIIASIIIIGLGITYYIVSIAGNNETKIVEASLKNDDILPLLKKENPNVYSVSVDSKQNLVAVYIKDNKVVNNKSILIKTADENIPLIEKLFKNPN